MTPSLSELLRLRLLLFDGATGTNIQTQNLTAEDFGGKALEGCNEYLVISKPDAVEKVHREFLEAGADIIETNSFGSTSIVLAEYDIANQAYELNVKAAQLAKKLAVEYSTAGKSRFVAGSMGPTTKLPSLGHITYDAMRASYYEQVAGLIEGGVDLLIVETCQDLLQIKAALGAIHDYFAEKNLRIPVIVSITIEMTGTMLMGTEIAAALAALEPYDIIDAIGMNCATGPKEMEENIRYLCENSPKPVFAMPNAGIPENVGGVAHYHLSKEEMVKWMTRFVTEFGISIIGGCCGTTPEHIQALADAMKTMKPHKRTWEYIPSVSSTYSSVAMHLDPPPILVGERCNANGSKKFRDLLLQEDYDSMVNMAKEQIREGAHILDVCVAYVGRDEAREMMEVIRRFNTQAAVPLMIDSTEVPVIEAALKLCAGRAIINSINLEDGEERSRKVLALCRKYGAAVVALTIDEDGMAKTIEKKLSIAKRIRNLAVKDFNMREEDIVFDALTFTLGSGDEEFRASALATIEGIRAIKREMPRAKTILGLSNVSFGLNPHSRHVLNSVFLHYALEAGLDMAIVHASKIMPLYKIDERGREICRKLIFDERKWETVAA